MRPYFAITALLLSFGMAAAVRGAEVTLEAPEVVLRGIDFEVRVAGVEPEAAGDLQLEVEGRRYSPSPGEDGHLSFAGVSMADAGEIALLRAGGAVAETEPVVLPAWFSVLPSLLAIAAALILRSVVPALFAAIWLGAWGANGLSATGLFTGLLDVFERYTHGALADGDHVSIVLFSLMIGGMVGIVTRNGGMLGVVEVVSRWAGTPRRARVATAGLGLAVFFDDIANTLVVGNAMRPVTDRLRVSREKLAFLVDATAAPIASVALVTTWIGYEVGLLRDALAGLDGFDESAYLVFLRSLAYSFYPWLMLFFVFLVAISGRDFGPMRRAERRALVDGHLSDPASETESDDAEGDLAVKEGIPHRAVNAILPVATLIGAVLAGLWVTGEGSSVQEIVGSADSYRALMWASFLATLVAAALSLSQRLLDLPETVAAWYSGLRAMLFAVVVLLLAWSLGAVTETLHTSDYLISLLGDALAPGLVPAVVFVLAAFTAFATGTSWGTMGILLPLVVPLAWAVLEAAGATADGRHVLYSSVACVLTGAVWGDHCSPISDTTILSSMASKCNHIDHVRTQMPYALAVGVSGLLLGTLPSGFGLHWSLGLLAGLAVLTVLLFSLGRQAEVPAAEAEA
jgi:Na+/H+ antiporter NhaC